MRKHGYWTKERCKKEALKHKKRSEFKKGSSGAYVAALTKGWLDEICRHMPTIKRPDGYWTKERCKKEALKYKKRSEFMKGSGSALFVARKNGWADEICKHMVSVQKPSGYWTKIRCKKEANKFKLRKEFVKESYGAYQAALRNGWLDEICKHMPTIKRPDGYWTKERCKKEALKYKTRHQGFEKGSSGAYRKAHQNGWLDEICKHMEIIRGKWTKQTCQKEAKKYKTRTEFQKGSGSAYSIAHKNGWLDKICKHMVPVQKPNGYWTKETIEKEAKKFKTKKDFRESCSAAYSAAERRNCLNEVCKHMVWRVTKPSGYWTKERCRVKSQKYQYMRPFMTECPSAYNASYKKGWLKEITSHMKLQGNRFRRMVYTFIFSDKYCYIGITCNFEKRFSNHLSNERSAIFKYLNNSKYSYEVLKTKYIYNPEQAKIEEGRTIERYKNKGFEILNIAPPGGVGGSTSKWTKEKCREEAEKYFTRKELRENCYIAYDRTIKKGWAKELFSHMEYIHSPANQWPKKKCRLEALKYNRRIDLQKGSGRAYRAARINGWLDDICKHMPKIATPKKYLYPKQKSQVLHKDVQI